MVGIKDMQMPKNCDECELWDWVNDKPRCNITHVLITSFCERNDECPLVEIDEVKE